MAIKERVILNKTSSYSITKNKMLYIEVQKIANHAVKKLHPLSQIKDIEIPSLQSITK